MSEQSVLLEDLVPKFIDGTNICFISDQKASFEVWCSLHLKADFIRNASGKYVNERRGIKIWHAREYDDVLGYAGTTKFIVHKIAPRQFRPPKGNILDRIFPFLYKRKMETAKRDMVEYFKVWLEQANLRFAKSHP